MRVSDYEAGTGYLQILPTTRGFAQRLKRELAGVGTDMQVPVRPELDRRQMTALQTALRSLPAVVLDADATPADREIAGLRDRIERLSGQTVGIDISAADAVREVQAIQAELDRLGRHSPNIAVRVDAGAASAALAGFDREVSRVDGRTARARLVVDAGRAIAQVASVALAVNQFANREYKFRVEADTAGAVASVAALVAKVMLLGGLGGIVGGFGGALGGLGAAGAVAGAGIASAVVASLGVGKALSALSAQQDEAASSARQNAKQQQASAYAIASAQDQVGQASKNAARARTDAARSVAAAEAAQVKADRTLRQATTDLRTEQATLTRAWEEGRRSLQDLQSQVLGNSIDQRQAAIDLRDAETDLRVARGTGNADAIERATVAYDRQKATVENLAQQGERLAADNADAQRKGVAGSDAVVSANDRIAAAQQRVEDASTASREAAAAVVQAQVDGADRIEAADQQVVAANRALAQAMAQSGDAGAAAADKVAAAFAALSPEAAAFARYLFGLKPLLENLSGVAATQFFPPLQRGIGLLVGQAPLITSMVAKLAGAMGLGLEQVLTQLASPEWMSFFGLLADSAGTIIPGLFGALMQVAGAGAVLIRYLLPLAPAAFDLLNQVAALVTILAPFIAQLLGGLIPAASAFLTALTPLGPVLAALQPILLVLGQAFATVLLAVLQALAPILVALTPLIQALAVELANQMVGAISTLTPFLVWVAQWMSGHPALVIGVIKVIGALALGFKPLLWILGIAATVLHGFLIRAAALFVLRSLGLEATLFGRAVMTILRPIELVKTAFGLVLRLVRSLFSPMQLVTGAARFLAGGILAIGRAVLGALGPFGIILTILGLLYSSNEQFRTTVQNLLQVLLGLGMQLLNAVMPAFQAVMGAISPLIPMLVNALVPVFVVLADVLSQLIATVLPPLVSILQTVVIPLITFWAKVLSTVLVWVIQNVVVPAIQAFAWFISNVLVPVILWLANTIVIPVFRAIGAFIGWVITNVVRPALDGLVWFWQNVLAPAISWLWTNIIQPVFGFIGAAANVLFQIVLVALILPLVLAFKLVAAIVGWLWTTIIQPTFTAIGEFIGWVWTALIKPAVDQLVGFIQNVLVPAVMWLWRNVIEPAFRGIGIVIGLVWDTVIQPTFEAIQGGLGWLQDGFRTAVDWIGKRWNDLRGLLAKPINFLIGTVFNDGIRKAWNLAADLLPGVDPIAELPLIPEAATGGIPYPGRYTPGRDIGLAWVSGQEAVMRPEWTRAVGTGHVDAMNAAARTGGVAGVRRALTASELALGGDTANPGRAYRRGGDGAALPAYAAGGVVDRGLAWANQQQGKPYGWGSSGPDSYDCSGLQSALVGVLLGQPPYQRRFSTASFSPGRGAGGLVPGATSAYTVGVTRDAGDGVGHMAATLGGTNVESRGSDGVVMGANARGADHPLFNMMFSLPQAGGVFTSGGTSGGSGGGFFDFLGQQIRGFFTDLTDPPINALKATFPTPPAFMGIPAEAATTVRDGALDFLLGSAAASGGGNGAAPSAQVHAWVLEALGILGYPTGYSAGIEQQIMTESGGDPRAVQHGYTDVNTISGDLAKGIMQVIGATFRANALPGHGDIFNPVDNIIAGSRYAMARYGAGWFSAGPQHNHGYDSGGIGKGVGWMWKGTGRDERVLDPVETQAYPTLTVLARELEANRTDAPAGLSTGQISAMRDDLAATARGRGGDTYNFNAADWTAERMLREADRIRDIKSRTS